MLKLSKYCEHWVDHNNSHEVSYLKWRDVAKEKGLVEVAENIDKAIQMLEKCNEYLLTAHGKL
jgi:hypothetical protein